MQSLVQQFLDQNKIHSLEGRRGVEGLAKLVNALGYSDSINRYGQMQGGACLGDIFVFLEDNSGAVEALVEWIQSRRSPEWKESLKDLVEQPALVVDQHKDCPECGQEVDPDAVFGDECDACGCVFAQV
jgi:hypothetical protein